MDFRFDDQQVAFRQQVRDFFANNVTPDMLEDQGFSDHNHKVYKLLADRGWLGMAWPKEYGGQDRTHIEQAIFSEELAHSGINVGAYNSTVRYFAASLMNFGRPDQKEYFLPKVLAGEIIVSMGWSEPNTGSDAASCQTRAVADGDDFVINGSKIFTSHGHFADYIYMSTRTDLDAPKHRGITLFIVPMKHPGVTIRPLWTMSGRRVNAVFFDDVRVSRDAMVGELNRGWYHQAATLDLERSASGLVMLIRMLFAYAVEYAKTHERGGRTISSIPRIREELVQMAADIERAWLLSYQVASYQSKGLPLSAEASMNKLFSVSLLQHMTDLLMEVLGMPGLRTDKEAPLDGEASYEYLNSFVASVAGGTNQIQKNIIANRGLGLPRG
jgi:alkylation response protein AidB-like acyl-CoA dehydrogenase